MKMYRLQNFKAAVIVLIFLLCYTSFSASGFQTDSFKEIVGFWEGTVEGENFIDRFVYHIYTDKKDQLSGIVYAFRNKQKKIKTEIDSLAYKKLNLYFIIKTDIKIEYKGFLIIDNQTIGGQLYYPNGTSVPWTLNRLYIKSIKEIQLI